MKRIRKCSTEGQPKVEENSKNKKTSTTLELIICPQENLSTIPEDISMMLPVTRLVDVCRYAPKSRQDAQDWGKLWPVQFKPNEVDRIRDRGLSQQEMLQIDQGRKELLKVISMQKLEDRAIESTESSAALIMNPSNSTVLINSRQATEYLCKSLTPTSSSSSRSFRELNPLYTTGMILIEGISAIVRGDEVISEQNDKSCENSIAAVPQDQYLLTGLDVYLQHEPDLMTAMAFLHSRVRRIYYLEANETNGALGSKYILNDMKKMNHRFRVFHLTATSVE